MISQKLKEALIQVDIAERHLMDAQGNNDPQHYQRASLDIHYAQSLLNSVHDIIHDASQEEQQQYHRAQEMMRILEETQASL
ncbi:hypothetical protein FZC79_00200 [Rossellomorea vietnamensis]|uniref:Uncharacterized protein n=2 Tax=Rossellomorea TaxID=2837508 RepID=A0A5D4KJ19_9BACI|nr:MULTISPECIES: hypothetical protein [Rossellomorea]TYR77281.1 hypothetical protein FZC79_00200 [Rossellomorea vietnamensis]TYS78115.1 hypothetical protein FZC80_12840 [Rossellomorea aquimaris]